jgi:hypothetical protein
MFKSKAQRQVPSFAPFFIGAAILVIGAALASAQDWSSGAVWALGLGAALAAAAAYAIPNALAAPRREERQGFSMGLATRPRAIREGELSPDRVLVLSGPPGSGKSQFAQQLVARHKDWALASCGELVKSQAASRQVKGDKRATDQFGQTLVEELGAEGFLAAVLEHAEVPADTRTLVIEDVYHVPVFDAIKRRWNHLHFVNAELPPAMGPQILREPGFDQGAAEQVKPGNLDHAVEELEKAHPPERSIKVPRDAGQFEAALAEIDEVLAQPA